MFAEIFLRIFSDCCILFALLGCCPSLIPYSFPLLAAALICSACAALAAFAWDRKKYTLSRLSFLLPFLSLLLAGSLSEIWILLPPVLYTAVTIARGNFQQEYFTYQKFFIRSLVLLMSVWLLIGAASWILGEESGIDGVVDSGIILRYTIVHFICGIMLQRHLRLGARGTSKSDTQQMAAILLTVGVIAVVFVLSEPMLRQWSASALWGVLSAIASVVIFLVNLVNQIQPADQYQEPPSTYASSTQPADPLTPPPTTVPTLVAVESTPADNTPWILATVALAVFIALLLMFLAYARRRQYSGGTFTFSEVADTEPKKRLPRLSNRAKVRQAYRDFLRQEQKRGLKLQKQYTTLDILLRISRQTDKAAAAQLREVYIHARYDDSREVTKAQADEARIAAKKLQ